MIFKSTARSRENKEEPISKILINGKNLIRVNKRLEVISVCMIV